MAAAASARKFAFRPCIDLHGGKVKQIVGSSLRDEASGTAGAAADVVTNFETDKSPAEFAELYRSKDLRGGHVIMLGPGNTKAALEAVAAFPGGLQVGGGITAANCADFLEAGASHVIVTSFVFKDGAINMDNLRALVTAAGGKERVVLDLSCRKRNDASATVAADSTDYFVVTDRWQRFTDFAISKANLASLEPYCSELLVHGVDVEGKQSGIEEPLVEALGKWAPVPVTYAGGVRSLADVDTVRRLGAGRVHVSVGSAMDTFGGPLRLDDVLAHIAASS